MMTIPLADARRICRSHGFSDLITGPNANVKLAKTVGWHNCGLSLAQGDTSGHEVCAGRGACFSLCLGDVGRTELFGIIKKARIARTRFLFSDPESFYDCLKSQLERECRAAARFGMPVAFRPNVLSDYPWHQKMPQLFSDFPDVQFYGYTKIRSNYTQFLRGNLHGNYYLTMSYSERLSTDACRRILRQGGTISVPFLVDKINQLPTTFLGFPVVDAVSSDLRFTDPRGCIAGLIAKKPRKKAAKKRFDAAASKTGFFVLPTDSRCGYTSHSKSA